METSTDAQSTAKSKDPSTVKPEQWKRLQELKRRREEIKDEGSKRKKPKRISADGTLNKEKEKFKETKTSTFTQNQVNFQPPLSSKPIITQLPKNLSNYIHMNSHLKGVDHGRLATKCRVEKELDQAVKNGDLDKASKISDQIAQRNYEKMIKEAIERKEFDEKRRKEEALKAKKKKPKLKWGRNNVGRQKATCKQSMVVDWNIVISLMTIKAPSENLAIKDFNHGVDLLNPTPEHERRQHKLKRLVQSPNSYFMDVKCPGCFSITTVFSHAQTVVLCGSCANVLCQPTGGRARLTE
ncbi:6786_t:CDS:2, partial [Acaulospora morrowiae]